MHVGYFTDEREAALAYDAVRLYGLSMSRAHCLCHNDGCLSSQGHLWLSLWAAWWTFQSRPCNGRILPRNHRNGAWFRQDNWSSLAAAILDRTWRRHKIFRLNDR